MVHPIIAWQDDLKILQRGIMCDVCTNPD